jgi:hypothetical protein
VQGVQEDGALRRRTRLETVSLGKAKLALHRGDAGPNIVENLPVGKPKDQIAFALEPTLAFDVAARHLGESLVNASVNLDNKLAAVRREVRKVPTNRRLTTEVRWRGG